MIPLLQFISTNVQIVGESQGLYSSIENGAPNYDFWLYDGSFQGQPK